VLTDRHLRQVLSSRVLNHSNALNIISSLDQTITEAYPKLVNSSPRATSVNCCAAFLVFFGDRDLLIVIVSTSRSTNIELRGQTLLRLSQKPASLLESLSTTRNRPAQVISIVYSQKRETGNKKRIPQTKYRSSTSSFPQGTWSPQSITAQSGFASRTWAPHLRNHKLHKMARRIGRPCAWTVIVPASFRSSLLAVRLMSVSCHQGKQ